MLRFLCVGDWAEPAVSTDWTASTRQTPAAVEAAIDHAWSAAAARLGSKLFDGPMCRLEAWHAETARLHLQLSRCSYRPFVGTNMTHPEFARQFGPGVMANPLGVSPILLSSDGWLLLGRRNDSVAYYPGCIHPFAGCLEPADAGESRTPNVFNAVRRELSEELELTAGSISEIRCVGMAEDASLLQCELMFFVRLALPRAQVEKQLDAWEHRGVFAVAATAEAVEPIVASRGRMAGQPAMTPVALASLLLWGRRALGDDWFSRAAAAVIVSPEASKR